MASNSKMGAATSAAAIMYLVLVVVIVFAFIMINVWGGSLLDEFQTEFNSTSNNYTNETQAAVNTMHDSYGGVVDSIGVFLLVGFWMLALVFGYNSHSNSFLAFLAILIVVVLGLVAMIISNTWEDVNSDTDISAQSANFPMLSFVMANYLIFVIVMGFSVVIAMFMGTRG